MVLYEKEYAESAVEIKVDRMRQLVRTGIVSSPGHEGEMGKFANDEVRKHLQNKIIWGFKEEVEMLRHNLQEAMVAFNRAVKIGSPYMLVTDNIDVCYSSEVLQEKAGQEKTHGRLKGEEIKRFKHKLDLSRKYLEKAERLDAEQEIVQWAVPLYQVLYTLDDGKVASVRLLIKQ